MSVRTATKNSGGCLCAERVHPIGRQNYKNKEQDLVNKIYYCNARKNYHIQIQICKKKNQPNKLAPLNLKVTTFGS